MSSRDLTIWFYLLKLQYNVPLTHCPSATVEPLVLNQSLTGAIRPKLDRSTWLPITAKRTQSTELENV